jgi:hypothetical protein
MHAILIAGAALVGLPILLHLIMKQEPKRLPFPALRFLKQKQRVNQRKMRLRHFLLLALRVLLIALFCAALFQPRVPSEGLNIGGEQPVAAVFILDTSPSMGYTADGKTRLAEVRRRALEFLDELPPGSRVAVLDPNDPLGAWEPSVGDARRKIEGLTEPVGGGPPVTAALPVAYGLFRALDEETDAEDRLPRLVVVFSDRTPESWKADRAEDLKKAAAVPPPAVDHLYLDVGVDAPANVSILAADPRPQLGPVGQPVTLTVTLLAAGPDVPSAEVSCYLDDAAVPERKELPLPAGTPTPVTFTFKDLKPGFHRARVTIRDDNLAADNVRYAAFRVGEGRKILTVTVDPYAAAFWALAHQTKQEFACDVVTPDKLPDLTGYEVVTLLSVANPAQAVSGGGTLWERLRGYIEKGGKVILIPGGDEAAYRQAYDPGRDDTQGLLPARLKEVITVPADQDGKTWDLSDDRTLRHPFLVPFVEWKRKGNVDFLRNPRRVRRYWLVADYQSGSVVVRYDDAPSPNDRSPAVLEKAVGTAGGKVVLLTTRLDTPTGDQGEDRWHNYWETAENSWAVTFPHLLARYLAGDTAEAAYNFPTGQAVALPLPKGDVGPRKLVLEGPGVSGPDAFPTVAERQTELRLPPTRTLTAGNYLLRTEDRSWQEGFALNPPAEEFNLAKVPVKAVEDLFGPNRVVPVGKEFKLKESLETRYNREVQLFPWLLIGVLLLIAAEGLVANRFYRFRGPPAS